MSSSRNSSVDFAQLTPAAPVAPAPSRESAARQARSLVAAAEAEANRIRNEAFEAGFAAGREDLRRELEPSVAALHAALAAVEALEGDLADRVEPQAVELAVQIAERVVAGAVELEPSRVVDVVRGALRTLVERERIVVMLHPDDVSFIREALPEVEVHEERRVTRGGAVVRTTLGEVDATIEKKLDRAREVLMAEASTS
jgi:flagellar assembly protein FliH